MLGSPSGVDGGHANSCAIALARNNDATMVTSAQIVEIEATDFVERTLGMFSILLSGVASGLDDGCDRLSHSELVSLEQHHFSMKQAAGYPASQANQLGLPHKHLDPLGTGKIREVH